MEDMAMEIEASLMKIRELAHRNGLVARAEELDDVIEVLRNEVALKAGIPRDNSD